ncbi:NAD-dependent epimerase/dehydratase family protein [Arenibacter sp. S6351L]|uniref:NAD-dependent epimerase/dehydratase family protein n=1 Tax=Arenibacter sp. S6351L TaxID=2926407 RepID=UPI001FF58D07|nr:NAD-dependent epimerase/dehydratase family protein [Arenibacter sp. S6351L]MCK0137251.1 NAD-dependent epimerase/dehydratase family protein [Arenibacter sp. S6351L]
MKKTLIIGGSGFVGSSLLKTVDINQFKIFDKNPSPFYPNITMVGDVRDYSKLVNSLKDIDTVILLAAEHRDDVFPTSLYYDVNVEGTRNVLKAMDVHKIKNLIFTSSVAVYGLNKDNPDESHPIDPFNHYGKSKWQAEQVIQEWYKLDNVNKNITILRPTVIFGERNRGNVYNLLKQISSGKFLMVGNGTNRKSMAYVGNVVAFINSKIHESNSGINIFNYVDKPDLTMEELTHVVSKSLNIKIPTLKIPYSIGLLGGYFLDALALITNKKYAISSVRVKKFCATTQFNAGKIENSFTSPYTLEKGLERTLNYEFSGKSKSDNIEFFSE